MLLKSLFVLSFVGLSYCAVAISPLLEKPKELEYKEGCYITEVEDVIPFNTTARPIGNCMGIRCTTTQLFYYTCGVVRAEEPYRVTEKDLTKPYPECCEQIVRQESDKGQCDNED